MGLLDRPPTGMQDKSRSRRALSCANCSTSSSVTASDVGIFSVAKALRWPRTNGRQTSLGSQPSQCSVSRPVRLARWRRSGLRKKASAFWGQP